MVCVALELDGDPLLHVSEVGPSDEPASLVADDVLRNRLRQPVRSNEASEPDLETAGVRGGMRITDIQEPPHCSDAITSTTGPLLESFSQQLEMSEVFPQRTV